MGPNGHSLVLGREHIQDKTVCSEMVVETRIPIRGVNGLVSKFVLENVIVELRYKR